MCRCALLVVLATLLFCGAAAPALADNRVALVIGNGAYLHAPHLPICDLSHIPTPCRFFVSPIIVRIVYPTQ